MSTIWNLRLSLFTLAVVDPVMASSSTRETYLERALRAEYKELLVRLLSADLYHKAFAITKEFAKLLDDQPPLLTNYTDVGSRADQKWAELKAECASWTQRAKVLAASGNLAKVGRLLSDVGRYVPTNLRSPLKYLTCRRATYEG